MPPPSPGAGAAAEEAAGALLFDNDGTLVDTLPFIHSVAGPVAASFGVELPWEDFLAAMMANVLPNNLIVDRAKEQGRPVELAAVDDAFKKGMMKAAGWLFVKQLEGVTPGPLRRVVFGGSGWPPALAPIAVVAAVVRRAKARGQKVALVTAGPAGWARFVLRSAGLGDLFGGSGAVIVASDTPGLKNPKPHPDPFLLAAEKLGVEPQNCVGYEDSDTGLAAIRTAGMRAVDVRQMDGYPRYSGKETGAQLAAATAARL